jgi:hypothetical protein
MPITLNDKEIQIIIEIIEGYINDMGMNITWLDQETYQLYKKLGGKEEYKENE